MSANHPWYDDFPCKIQHCFPCAGIQMLGTVLNRVDVRDRRYGYGYYYYYDKTAKHERGR